MPSARNSKRLRLTAEAELDLEAARLWYQRQESDRAADFLAAIDASLATIHRHPQGFTLVDPTNGSSGRPAISIRHLRRE